MTQLPFCSFRCQDVLLKAIWSNDMDEFERIVNHVGKYSLTVDTIKLGETIAEISLSNKPQWFETLRALQKYPFSHRVLQATSENAYENHDIPTLLFVFNELRAHHNLQRNSVLLELFPVVHIAHQVLRAPLTPEIEQTLPKMLEVCSPSQCRFLLTNCVLEQNFTHIEAFNSQIDLNEFSQDVQIHYQKGNKAYEAAVTYFQHRALHSAVGDIPSILPLKRKI